MTKSKKLWLLIFCIFLFDLSHAQDLKWLLGTWTGPTTTFGKIHMARSIVIDSIDGVNFTGTRSNEADDKNNTKIVTSISGYLNEEKFYMKAGKILFEKDPPHDAWVNCGSCPFLNKIIIQHDTVFLHCEISGCNKYCDGVSIYYKLLPDYDTATQRQVVNLFGDSLYIVTFKPYDKNAMKHKQEVDDSLKNAALIASKRQLQIDDSLRNAAIIAAKRRQQVDDSLKNAAIIAKKQHEQYVQDSLRNAAIIAKQRQKQVDDSLKAVAMIAAKRQKQVDDSLRNAAIIAKKRQQQVDDSLKNEALVAKKHQQEIDDSLKAVAFVAYQKHIDDSLKIAASMAKKKPESAALITSIAATNKALEQRENVLVQSIHISTPDILIELFDNAQIDGDVVSVYHNKDLIVNKKTLLREPITLTVHADSANRTHEFILIAENLGSIPPNTALMRITAGKQKYQLTVKTDLANNAKIILYYDGN